MRPLTGEFIPANAGDPYWNSFEKKTVINRMTSMKLQYERFS